MGRAIPEPPRDFDKTRIVERPDGFYWQSEATGEEYGPFPTRAEALADIEFGGTAEEEPSPTRRWRRPRPTSACPAGSIPTPAISARAGRRGSRIISCPAPMRASGQFPQSRRSARKSFGTNQIAAARKPASSTRNTSGALIAARKPAGTSKSSLKDAAQLEPVPARC